MSQDDPTIFQRVFDHHSSMMWLLDATDQTIVEANDAAAAFYGYTKDEMRGMSIEQINRTGRKLITCTINQILSGRQHTFQLTHTLSSGEERIIQIHSSPVEIESKVLLLTILHDITEQEHAKRALARGKQIFGALIEHSLDMIIIVEEDGTISFASPSVVRVLGWEPSDLTGRPATDLLHPDELEDVRGRWRDLLRDPGGVAEITHRFQCKDDDWRIISSHLRNMLNYPEMRGIVINSRDITERHAIEEELRRYATKLEANNRELEEFAYVASHDLQEPLRKIRAFGDRLRRVAGDDLGEREVDYIARMNGAAERMSELIEDLLEYSRLSTRTRPKRPTDLMQVLEGVLSDLEIMIREHEASFDIGALPTIDADPMQMRQLFQNLVANAIKFRKPEVAPVISIHARDVGHGDGPGGHDLIELIIEDNGIGFDQKHADTIFTPFQRLHARRTYKGTGIGLAVCRKIAEQHQGSIQAFSAPDEGATFMVILPKAHDDA